MPAKKKSVTTPLHLLQQLSHSLIEHLDKACSQAIKDAEGALAKLQKQRGKAQDKLTKARAKLDEAGSTGKPKAQTKARTRLGELEESLILLQTRQSETLNYLAELKRDAEHSLKLAQGIRQVADAADQALQGRQQPPKPAAARPAAGKSAPAAAKPAPRPNAAAAPAAAKPATAKAAEPEHTVRVDTKRLDAIVNLIGELVLSRNRLKTLRTRLKDEELDRAVSTLDIATARLQSAVMRTRMQPVGKVFSRFPKVARDVARSLQKEVDLELIGADTELDRNLVEALADPLVHLVRNAIDHGVEGPDLREAQGKPRMGRVRLSAQQEGDYVSIEVQDDGAGIDPERLRNKAREKGLIDPEAAARLSSEECLHLVFLPGFSTKQQVTDISGRGVGMDVVQSRIRELSGQIQIQSELGRGSRFLIRVPLTLAILPTLLVQAGDDVYALPLARVMEVLHAPATSLGWFDGRAVLDRKSHTLALVDLRDWLGVPPTPSTLLTIVVLQMGETRFGLVVDQVRGREEVVIKPLPRALRGLKGYAGATLIGDGRMALILDVDGLRGGQG